MKWQSVGEWATKGSGDPWSSRKIHNPFTAQVFYLFACLEVFFQSVLSYSRVAFLKVCFRTSIVHHKWPPSAWHNTILCMHQPLGLLGTVHMHWWGFPRHCIEEYKGLQRQKSWRIAAPGPNQEYFFKKTTPIYEAYIAYIRHMKQFEIATVSGLSVLHLYHFVPAPVFLVIFLCWQ